MIRSDRHCHVVPGPAAGGPERPQYGRAELGSLVSDAGRRAWQDARGPGPRRPPGWRDRIGPYLASSHGTVTPRIIGAAVGSSRA
eukprot:766874-Hanusia_phi.AAC.2